MLIQFDDLEAYEEAEKKAQEAAALQIPIWAANCKVGDFFTREVKMGHEVVSIWGEILPNISEDEDENEIILSYEGDAYRFANCFSLLCPDGELGSVHLSVIGRLVTAEEFEAARARGWS